MPAASRNVVPLPAAFLQAPLTHRGLHDRAARRAENSLSAFLAAVEGGYGIELDVQLSADGQAMVFHDDRLNPVTRSEGAVRDHTAADLATVHLRDSDDFVPTLPQVLALVAGRVPVLIEIKELLDTMSQTEGRLEQAVATALAACSGPVAVMSFNPYCVAHMARLAPHVARGLVTEAYDPKRNFPIPAETCARLREIPDYDATGCSFISHQASDLERPRVHALKAQGAAVLCWTVRSLAEEAQARLVADNVTFEGYRALIPR